MTSSKKSEVLIDRRKTSEDRRQSDAPVASDRRKVQRRRQIDPTTCERDYTEDEIEFMHALDAYKRANGRMFPTCSEILEVIRDMGYVRLPVEASDGSSDSISESPEAEPLESASDFATSS